LAGVDIEYPAIMTLETDIVVSAIGDGNGGTAGGEDLHTAGENPMAVATGCTPCFAQTFNTVKIGLLCPRSDAVEDFAVGVAEAAQSAKRGRGPTAWFGKRDDAGIAAVDFYSDVVGDGLAGAGVEGMGDCLAFFELKIVDFTDIFFDNSAAVAFGFNTFSPEVDS
jgi:hypothetical protein